MRFIRKSLPTIQRKLHYLLLFMLVPILMVQACYYYYQFQLRQTNELQANLEVARAIAEVFEKFVLDAIHQELAIGLHLTYPHLLPAEEMKKILVRNQQASPVLRNIAWVSPQGRIVAASMAASMDLDVRHRQYFRDIITGKEWTVSDLISSAITGEPVFAIARGIRDEEGNLLGIVCGFVTSEGLNGMLEIQRMAEGTITVLDRNARVVHRHPRVEWSWEERGISKDHPALRDALAGREVMGTFPGFRGPDEKIMAVAPVKSIGWSVIASRPVKAVVEPIKSQLFQQAALFLAIIVAVFMAALASSRSIAVPLRKLREHATELGGGNWDRSIEVEGCVEVRDLALAFNTMTREISSREKALAESNEKYRLLFEHSPLGVFHFNEKGIILNCNESLVASLGSTKEKVIGFDLLADLKDECVKEALSICLSGRVCCYEGFYRSVTGTKSGPMRAMYGPILSRDGTILGGIALIEDISERVKAQEELRLNEVRFETLYELNQMTEASAEEMYRFVLERQLQITKSGVGAIVFINEDESMGISHAWSRNVMEQCSVVFEEPIRFPVDKAGLWAETVRRREPIIVNDYENAPFPKRGFPRGHIPLHRFLAIPVFDEDRIALVAMVGNKEEEYDASDVRQLELLMDGMWQHLRKREAQEALEESEKQLRVLSSRLISAHEEERRRIARELHDSIGSSLAAVLVALETTADGLRQGAPSAGALDPLKSILKQAMEESRRIMTDLRPSILDDLGIVAAINWCCRRFQSVYAPMFIEKCITVEESHVPEPLKITIFRIIQEALNNAAKYSGAQTVQLSLIKADTRLELTVADNGKGFDVHSVSLKRNDKGGLGMTSMKERAELSGGTFQIESAIGKGTTIRAAWPTNRNW